ncbi:hypothetical protein ACWV95_36650 [Streptomyces albus]
MGMSMGTFRNKKPYTAQGFPAPISSPQARVLLWDGEQTAAYLAGTPVPDLPPAGGEQDLLDRHEAAAELGVKTRSWDAYKTDPLLASHMVVVCGVEHWPRGTVRAFQDTRPGKSSATGRPKGKGNAVPRNQLHAKVAALLDAKPAVTVSEVCDALGVAPATAQRALANLRRERIAQLAGQASLSYAEAAERLGFPPTVRRAALKSLQNAPR